MCLNLLVDKRKYVAEEDITVYKHLLATNEEFFLTPYRKERVLVPSTVTSFLDTPTVHDEIGKAIHSFVYADDAAHDMEEEVGYYAGFHEFSASVVVECVIPKGAKYYVGRFAEMHAFASNKLKYIRVIPRYTIMH